jgi:hypothetical protein
MGPIGLTGTMGPIGLTGTMGPIGLTGTMGPIGLTGTMGPIGLTGTRGPIGLTGTMGPTGPSGPMGSAVTNNNYVWGFKTDTQIVVGANTFETIKFTNLPELNGWTYNSTTGNFTCNQSGKYLVSYIVIMSATGGSRVGTTRGVINGNEIIGSANTQNFQSTSINQEWTNSFIMNVTSGQTFTLQVAGSSAGNETINFTSPIASETPISSSIIITRIV